jgi:hypothetical protein
MTKDSFRRFQKVECLSGAKYTIPTNNARLYGCGCCRKIPSLNKFKKWSRRLARRRLKQQPLE